MPDNVVDGKPTQAPRRLSFGDRLAVVNSHLDTGYPPTNPTYEVLIVHA